MGSELIQSFKRKRKVFTKHRTPAGMPGLIEVQLNSYRQFLQAEVEPENRILKGLQAVFNSVFPIKDYAGSISVEFVSYSFDEPKYSVEECRQRGMSFSAPLKVIIRLVVMDIDSGSDVQSIRDVKEQEVFFGELPLMTDSGTFVINGTERVVVSQLHRSPGVFFSHDRGKTHASRKLLYSARVIPYRGSWLDFEFDSKDFLFVRIDRRRKLYVTILLKALGYNSDQLLEYFYDKELITLDDEGSFRKTVDLDLLRGQKANRDILNEKTGDIIIKKNRKYTAAVLRRLEKNKIQSISIESEELIGKVLAEDVIDFETGEIIVPINTSLSATILDEIIKRGIRDFSILFIDGLNVDGSLQETLVKDDVATTDEALITIYKRIRPGDPPTLESAVSLFSKLFFDKDRYDLSEVGRLKLNHKLDLDVPIDQTTLTKDDILRTVRHLLDLKNNRGRIDDIDHLGNRRVRAVGELLENQYRIGLLRIERAIKERMSLQEVDTLLPHDLVNSKPVSAVVKEFFGSSQLSQFMDQTNPLSEITHKRRLSALGPGGLTRERAGFEVRDVHTTHYGRICPIETPEGPNIGLITSLATYGVINKYGFIETPYRTVVNGKITEEVKFYSALDEQNHVIVQANVAYDRKTGAFDDEMVPARVGGEFSMTRREDVDLMDIATNQLVSAAASLIPFLQNDDANRALMGANMQRQAVPLMNTAAPIVGTGIEVAIARDSGATVVAKNDGVVEFADSRRIAIKRERTSDDTVVGTEVDIYKLTKYQRSNQDTCINQKPIVDIGEHVKVGDIIADGFSTEVGELALGQNCVVAFMSWQGYNFEDSILISEKVVKEEIFTSFHIQEFECIARDTKLGKEEITNDIPNVGDESMKNIDEAGIIRVGAHVKPGDILVGKITPKGETNLTPEEKLLRAIFGEKAGDVRDTSLRVPPGVIGTAISAKVFTREGIEKDSRAKLIEEGEIKQIRIDEADKVKIIKESASAKLANIITLSTVAKTVKDDEGNVLFKVGAKIEASDLVEIAFKDLGKIQLKDVDANGKIRKILDSYKEKIDLVRSISEEKINKVKKGDELPPGVIKMVKVYVAIKRKLSVGDKMAGRHGNKGVISVILPEEDMPYLEDGTPVDVVLNPLGVPSRMNVGQVLECHIGWAGLNLGKQLNAILDKKDYTGAREFIKKIWDNDEDVIDFIDSCTDDEVVIFGRKYRKGINIANPVFDGASEIDIRKMLKLAGLAEDGKSTLYDGRSGNKFSNRVAVGVMYVLKLHHLVEDKIHARSIGPYSLVTQQPLGGKAQFGGQRLGEMEVWALEAYGAAYALQGFLTVKSDDVVGRTKIYESIVKGENSITPGLPESFNVLMKELQSLVLDVRLIKEEN